VDEPLAQASSTGQKKTGGFGDTKLIDLFAATSMGRAIIGFVMGDKEFEEFEKSGEITFTDSPPTSEQVEKGLDSAQKKDQTKAIERMKATGAKVLVPNYKDITSSSDFDYKKAHLASLGTTSKRV
jgi:hypothetical protein